MSAMASQITSLRIVYSTVYSSGDQRKHQSSASLAFVRGIHRRPVNSPHKGPVTRKMFPFDDVIMTQLSNGEKSFGISFPAKRTTLRNLWVTCFVYKSHLATDSERPPLDSALNSAAEIRSPGRQLRPMNPTGDPTSYHGWSVWRPMNSLCFECKVWAFECCRFHNVETTSCVDTLLPVLYMMSSRNLSAVNSICGWMTYILTQWKPCIIGTKQETVYKKYNYWNSKMPQIHEPNGDRLGVPLFMTTSSNGNIFRVTGLCEGNSPVTGEFPSQRPVTRSFGVFFDLPAPE